MRKTASTLTRSLFAFGATVGLVLGGTLPSSAAGPDSESDSKASLPAISGQLKEGISTDSEVYSTIKNSPGFHYAPAPDGSDPEPQSEDISPLWVSGDCNYNGKADYPHVTNGEASVHGYWVRNSAAGTCPDTAKVTVDLQAWACSSLYGCGWVTQDTDQGTFEPGSGTGRWATPHKACVSTAVVGWRGRVDVDLSWQVDPFGYDYSQARDLSCSPA